jgi:hypothetical protein
MAKKRSAAPAPAVEAIHWPLPAGQNPGDPFYGGLDPSNPSDRAVIAGKLAPAAYITDAAQRVLHLADRTIEACPNPSDKTLVASSRHWLANAVAALATRNLPKEVWQEIDTVIQATSTISRMGGNVEQARSARKTMKRARVAPAQKGRKDGAEARRAEELKIIKDKKWSLKQDDLPGKLRGELAKSIGKLWSPSTIREDVNILRRGATT